MAFRFTWPEFDQEFYVEAKSQLEAALNKGNKPPVIVDHVTVKELNMGTKPPELEILEIGEIGNDKFRGIFKLNYAGDAYIEVQTKVQANPLHAKTSELPRHSRPSILAADQPLVVPMILRISDLKLRGIVVLVVSKTKGVTLVFKNDPLESIRISSTFDSVSILRDFLQRQIEAQLRKMLQDDLPVMIHNLSLRFIQSEEEKKKKSEQEERVLQQQKRFESVYSRKQSPSNRSRSWSDFSSLPELDDSSSSFPLSPTSQSSAVYTPITGSFNLNDSFYNYTSSPTSTCFESYMESNNLGEKNDNLVDMVTQNLEALNVDDKTNSDYFHFKSVPITMANLYTHNRCMNQLGLHPINNISQQNHQQRLSQQHDLISENGLSTVTGPCPSMSEIYADDADAPWYATEGPELYSSVVPLPQDLPMDDKMMLNLEENTMTARLSQLTSTNYTLSPLTDCISNCTFRSLPYVKKSTTHITRHKKIPKRRTTRLSMTIPRL